MHLPSPRALAGTLATLAAFVLAACSSSTTSSNGDGGLLGGGDDDGGASGEGGGATDGGGSGTDSGPVDAGSEQVLINFDDLADHTVLADQYAAHAHFTSDSGHFITLQQGDIPGESLPNYACSSSTAGICGYTYPAYVDFTKPVRALSFRAVGVGSGPSKFGTVKVVHGGTTTMVDMIGPSGDSWVKIDLSAFDAVTRIEIENNDGAGIGMDDFSFVAPK